VQTVGRELDPLQARSSAPSVGEGTTHRQRTDDGAEVTERAGEPGAPDAVDDDHVRRIQRHHVVRDDLVRPPPAMSTGDTDLDDVALVEPVEAVQTGGGAVRCDGVPTIGERGRDHTAMPAVVASREHEHARIRLAEPPQPFGGGDAATVEVEFGSLATGERTMLRGCKLGNGAYSVVEHVRDGTRGVSHRRRRRQP
jgi:hypothetical protein